ncbi:MAG: Fic family protein [Flavobacteriales bacterium]|nr:Fic family protein [Flavobacteriales bacterium]
MERIYIFDILLDWKLISAISTIDRFDASWSSIEKTEGASLRQLRQIATIRSVGASTRIEGSKMSDAEVNTLLQNIDLTKLEDRDAQEVTGYFNVLDLIVSSFENIPISENSLKNLHNQLLKYSQKDQWHKGNYKQHSNSVEAVLPDGSKQLVFETTPAGVETEDAMRNLIDWYRKDNITHPLVKCALFAYEFVSIHPFQDGNGRLSRLLTTLLLLKNGYSWIQYVSFEHEIEHRKSDYYLQLRTAQAQRPNENVSDWVHFFLDSLTSIQTRLLEKLAATGISSGLSPKRKSIMAFISDHPGSGSGQIAERLDIPNPTVKRILKELVDKNLIEKHGVGRGTNYSLI